MHITFTEAAQDKLQPVLGDGGARLKLVFDSEGCGCAMNGVPTLWLVSQPDAHDETAEGAPYPVLFRGKDEIFFEERMKIDYHLQNKCFILKSNSQIYNAGMSLVDQR